MPAFLVTLLTNIITPIVEKIIGGLMLNQRLNDLEKKQSLMIEGFSKLNAAKTDEDYSKALDDITRSWNS